ncbi:GntR family transcriptional regulator [Dactylosporangium sp. NBC_01737]|uniref:GntR family transcriptional regulator n=1 Tax=Dactylosporangium sp. NBC_01737 TaxID=2975959 RepID=UPI002E159B52|nr:GntR family transcriptional regulator [Dactylosporangium sp. NBC_01737]
MSRTPVREAIRRLHSEGLIDVFPNRGAYVRTWTRTQLDELFSVRALLEGRAAALAARHATDEQRAALEVLCDAMDAAETDLSTVVDLNDRFHALIHEASANSLLPGLIRGLVQVPVVVRTFLNYSPVRLRVSLAQHWEILAAIAGQDSAWAEAAMRAHILSARHEITGPP